MRCFLLITSLLSTSSTFSQQPGFPPDKPEKINYTKYPLQERRSLYPFGRSSEIKIVSFPVQVDTINGRVKVNYGLPFVNDTLCTSKLHQVTSLNQSQIDTLTDILYNSCSRWTIRESSSAACYMPHNAIVFYDNKSKFFEYIEICFSCSRYRYSSAAIVNFEHCGYMFDDLEKFFRSLGLKTTDEDLDADRLPK